MYYIVEYHADGGQMCIPGLRTFENMEKAEKFADKMINEKGHTCKDSVEMYTSEINLGFKKIVPDKNADDHKMENVEENYIRRSYANSLLTRL